MAKNTITSVQQHEIERLYSSGVPVHKIAIMFNLTEHEVDRCLHRL